MKWSLQTRVSISIAGPSPTTDAGLKSTLYSAVLRASYTSHLCEQQPPEGKQIFFFSWFGRLKYLLTTQPVGEADWLRAPREKAREKPQVKLLQLRKRLGGRGASWAVGGLMRAGEAMNYAAGCKNLISKVFWERSHSRTVTLPVFCFSLTPSSAAPCRRFSIKLSVELHD